MPYIMEMCDSSVAKTSTMYCIQKNCELASSSLDLSTVKLLSNCDLLTLVLTSYEPR